MDLYENYKGIYISPDALLLVMEHQEAITIEGMQPDKLKATPGVPQDTKGFDKIEQDGVTIYISSKVDMSEHNLNINRSSWWKPGKLEVSIDDQKPPVLRL